MCCFSAKYTAHIIKRKDRLALNQVNLFDRGDMSIRGLLFQ
jgi:hypothetical protein